MYMFAQLSQKVYSCILKTQIAFSQLSWLKNSYTFRRLNFGSSYGQVVNTYAHLSGSCRQVFNNSGNCSSGFNVKFRQFHTTQTRPIHPLIILILRPLTKAGAILVGRGVRKWWQSLPPNKKKYVWDRIKEQRIKIYGTTGIITCGTIAFYQTHLEETPVSKRKRFILFDAHKYNSITDEIYKMNIETHRDNLIPVSHPSYKLVSRIVERLLSGNKDLDQVYNKSWSITIVNDSNCNAYVLPNGQIFVFTGMIKFCENEDQLGCILGHEMAHAILGHSAEMLSHTHLIDMAMMVVIALIWALLPSDIISVLVQSISTKISDLLLHLPYNRMLESEADTVGLQLAAKACFDIREIVVFWKKLKASASASQSEMPIEWLSTHPLHYTRASTLNDLVPECLETRKQHQCPPLPKGDPRDTIAPYEKWLKSMKSNIPVGVYVAPPSR